MDYQLLPHHPSVLLHQNTFIVISLNVIKGLRPLNDIRTPPPIGWLARMGFW